MSNATNKFYCYTSITFRLLVSLALLSIDICLYTDSSGLGSDTREILSHIPKGINDSYSSIRIPLVISY